MPVSIFFITLLTTMSSLFHVALADQVQEVLTITSDARPGEIYKLYITTDDSGDLTGMDFQGKNYDHYSLEALKNPVRMMPQVSGRDIITLTAPSVDPQSGGTAVLRYLVNGLSMNYQTYLIDVVRLGGQWAFFTMPDRGHRAFSQMFLKKNTLLGQTIGIDHIEVQ